MAEYLTGILRIFSDDAETESNVHLTRAERIRAYQEENKHLGALVIVNAKIVQVYVPHNTTQFSIIHILCHKYIMDYYWFFGKVFPVVFLPVGCCG